MSPTLRLREDDSSVGVTVAVVPGVEGASGCSLVGEGRTGATLLVGREVGASVGRTVVGLGTRVGVRVRVALGSGVTVCVEVALGSGVTVCVDVALGAGVRVRVGLAVAVGVGVCVAVALGVGVRVTVAVGLGVTVEVSVGSPVNVGAEVGAVVDTAVGSAVASSRRISSEVTVVRPSASRNRTHTVFGPPPGSNCHSIRSR